LGLGQISLTNGFGGTAGEYFEIARNTFLGTNRQNFDLRGEPCYSVELHHNVSLRSLKDAIACTYCEGGINKLKVYDNNQFNASNPTTRLGVGDFDGDGKEDLFLATGAAWYYAPAGQAEWRFLNAQTDKIDTLLFGDFDGDKRTDVFTQHDYSWDVSWGGAGRWEKINVSGRILGQAAIGDFDGDKRADVFYADGHEWFVSFGGVGQFTHFALAAHRVSDLRFGDFNSDGKTDVFGVVGDLWMVVYGGTQYWAPLRAKLTDSAAGLTVADFDGDGRADVARIRIIRAPKTHSAVAEISRGGTDDWTRLRYPSMLVGRFDDSPGADVLLFAGNHFAISSGGLGVAVSHSRQDMR
jgi:hypothetical protein